MQHRLTDRCLSLSGEHADDSEWETKCNPLNGRQRMSMLEMCASRRELRLQAAGLCLHGGGTLGTVCRQGLESPGLNLVLVEASTYQQRSVWRGCHWTGESSGSVGGRQLAARRVGKQAAFDSQRGQDGANEGQRDRQPTRTRKESWGRDDCRYATPRTSGLNLSVGQSTVEESRRGDWQCEQTKSKQVGGRAGPMPAPAA